jgi:hypothetical protein
MLPGNLQLHEDKETLEAERVLAFKGDLYSTVMNSSALNSYRLHPYLWFF